MPPRARDLWTEVDALFDEALQRPPDERTAWLRIQCGEDAALYQAVATLLANDAAAADALGESATVFAAHLVDSLAESSPDGLSEGTRVGPYRIIGELGRGGMGTVYRAARADGTFEKEVALKVVKRGMDTEAVLARFRYERQILAGLDHPYIARLLDAGATEDGRPYLVMERAEGEAITAYAERHGLPLLARLDLFEGTVEAVRYAHRRLVVHRDLKPSNILVATDEDGTPRIKLLDFGIARLLDTDEAASSSEPRFLTPEYAAPEQRRGDPATTATDVYALGVLGYQLLTGHRPGPDPAPLSTLTGTQPFQGDLDALVLTALHPDPGRRYASAEALLDDLRRLRAGQPLGAHPTTLRYRLRKFVSRHRPGVAVAVAVVLGLVLTAAVLVVQQQATVRARDEAEASAAFLESLFAATNPFEAERMDTLRVRDLLSVGAERVRVELTDQPRVQARLLRVLGATLLQMGQTAEAEPLLRETVRLLASGPPERRAEALVTLAAIRRERGDHAEAEDLVWEALAALPDRAAPAVRADAETGLALILRSTDRQDEAAPLHQAALARLRTAHGDDHPATLDAEAELAGFFFETGQLARAERHYRAVLERMRRIDGGAHPRHHPVLDPLAFLLRVSGRLDEAEEFAAQSVTLAREAVPGTARLGASLTGHAGILAQLGRSDEAEALLIEALALPARRPRDRSIALGALASLRQQRGDWAGAEEAQREAWILLRDALGANHRIAAHSAIKLGRMLSQQQRFAEAERLMLDAHRALTGDTAGSPMQDREVAGALADLYVAWGRPGDAARWRQDPE